MGSVWGGVWAVVCRSRTALGLNMLFLDLVWMTLGGVGDCGACGGWAGTAEGGTAVCAGVGDWTGSESEEGEGWEIGMKSGRENVGLVGKEWVDSVSEMKSELG